MRLGLLDGFSSRNHGRSAIMTVVLRRRLLLRLGSVVRLLVIIIRGRIVRLLWRRPLFVSIICEVMVLDRDMCRHSGQPVGDDGDLREWGNSLRRRHRAVAHVAGETGMLDTRTPTRARTGVAPTPVPILQGGLMGAGCRGSRWQAHRVGFRQGLKRLVLVLQT